MGLRPLLEHLCAALGRSWSLCCRSWGGLGIYVGDRGPLLWLCGRSCAALGASVCGPGPLSGPLCAILVRSWVSTRGLGSPLRSLYAVLGRSWSLCWRSWGGLGCYVGDLRLHLGTMWLKNAKEMATLKMNLLSSGRAICGLRGGLRPLLGPLLEVLGCSWTICCRSWVALGNYVCDLRAFVHDLEWILRPWWRSGAILGRQVAKTQAGRQSPCASGHRIGGPDPGPRAPIRNGNPKPKPLRPRNPFPGGTYTYVCVLGRVFLLTLVWPITALRPPSCAHTRKKFH